MLMVPACLYHNEKRDCENSQINIKIKRIKTNKGKSSLTMMQSRKMWVCMYTLGTKLKKNVRSTHAASFQVMTQMQYVIVLNALQA